MKLLGKNILAKTKFLKLIEQEYINLKGETAKWVFAERAGNRKAVMIIARKDDKLVLIKEFRIPIGNFEWSFPAGLIDENEDIETAARREFKEETGLDISEIIKISPFAVNSAGLSNEVISMVFAKASGEINYSGHEASEELSVYLADKDFVKKILSDTGNIISAKAWIIMDNFLEN